MMHQAAYRFFDTSFRLETDAPAFLARFEQTYAPFRVAPEPGMTVYRLVLLGQPALNIDGQTVRSADAGSLAEYAYNAMLGAAMAQVRSHFLFHGAALATPAGKGVILAGHSGLGKTTLTVALLRHGWRFFSDDMAAVGRTDGRLYPFPRRLGLRVPGGRPGEKRLLDAEDVAPGCLADGLPCPASALFVLTDPRIDADQSRWYLLLDRVDSALVADLGNLPCVQAVRLLRDGPYPAVQFDLGTAPMSEAEPAITAVCQHHGALVFDIVHGREVPPNFAADPVLAPLTPSQAALALMSHLKNGPRAGLLQHEFDGSASRLYIAVAGLVAHTRCYQLAVGRLTAMVDLILQATYHVPPEGPLINRSAITVP